MISIVAKGTLKAGMKAKCIEITKNLIEKSNQEEGCISYALYEDIKDENVVTFLEEWKDMEAINIHNNSEHFTTTVPLLGELFIKPMEVNLYSKL